jgi:hypothetical protein
MRGNEQVYVIRCAGKLEEIAPPGRQDLLEVSVQKPEYRLVDDLTSEFGNEN